MKRTRELLVVGELRFGSKKSLRDYVRRILYGGEWGSPVVPHDFHFLLSFLTRHPDASRLIGCGVAEIFPDYNPAYSGSVCFWLRRLDGTVVNFSYLECLTTTSHRGHFLAACRTAVADEIISFKRAIQDMQGARMTCVVSGLVFATSTGHVDHIPPDTFLALVERWVKESQIDISRLEILPGAPGEDAESFADSAVAESWAAFHLEHSRLRLISPAANLSTVRRLANSPENRALDAGPGPR
jgi:hypothetical protein